MNTNKPLSYVLDENLNKIMIAFDWKEAYLKPHHILYHSMRIQLYNNLKNHLDIQLRSQYTQ